MKNLEKKEKYISSINLITALIGFVCSCIYHYILKNQYAEIIVLLIPILIATGIIGFMVFLKSKNNNSFYLKNIGENLLIFFMSMVVFLYILQQL